MFLWTRENMKQCFGYVVTTNVAGDHLFKGDYVDWGGIFFLWWCLRGLAFIAGASSGCMGVRDNWVDR